MGAVIVADGVGKRYRLGDSVGRLSVPSVRRLLDRRRAPSADEIWSLRDVSFEVGAGEALGVIGRNGAGKTTLLRLLSRITTPTEGLVRTRGRVGSLLEVGTGFHGELTGRENVYLNAAVLGLRRRDIDRRFDDIVAFAGVERFLDTPIKRYSTGMHLRLAFAVAAHIDTDILLVDEVLAVGDAEFQRACMRTVRSAGSEGRTVVFVSHDLGAVSSLCPTTIWLDAGRVAAMGPTRQVVDAYLASGFAARGRRTLDPARDGPVGLVSVAVLDERGSPSGVVRSDRPFTLEAELDLREHVPNLDVALCLSTTSGTRIVDEALSRGSPADRDRSPCSFGGPGRYAARVTVPPMLRSGEYVMSVWAGAPFSDEVLWEEQAMVFRLEGELDASSERLLELGLPVALERLDP